MDKRKREVLLSQDVKAILKAGEEQKSAPVKSK